MPLQHSASTVQPVPWALQQKPPSQASPAGQLLPQAAQLFVSVCVLVQPPPQQLRIAGQPQLTAGAVQLQAMKVEAPPLDVPPEVAPPLAPAVEPPVELRSVASTSEERQQPAIASAPNAASANLDVLAPTMPMCRVYGRRGTSATRPPAKSPRPGLFSEGAPVV